MVLCRCSFRIDWGTAPTYFSGLPRWLLPQSMEMRSMAWLPSIGVREIQRDTLVPIRLQWCLGGSARFLLLSLSPGPDRVRAELREYPSESSVFSSCNRRYSLFSIWTLCWILPPRGNTACFWFILGDYPSHPASRQIPKRLQDWKCPFNRRGLLEVFEMFSRAGGRFCLPLRYVWNWSTEEACLLQGSRERLRVYPPLDRAWLSAPEWKTQIERSSSRRQTSERCRSLSSRLPDDCVALQFRFHSKSIFTSSTFHSNSMYLDCKRLLFESQFIAHWIVIHSAWMGIEFYCTFVAILIQLKCTCCDSNIVVQF